MIHFLGLPFETEIKVVRDFQLMLPAPTNMRKPE
jgi:hypothetical protein